MAETETGHGHAVQTVTIPGTKKKIPKTWAYVAAGVVGVLGIVWYRGRSGSASAGDGTATDPGTDAGAADTSGEAFGGGTGDFGAGLQGGGGIIGYDSNGNPIYGNTTGNQVSNGPPFTSNGAWSQYAVSVLTTLDQTALTNALGAYIGGQPVTPAQRTLIDDAISVAGKPPETGANGFPPSINVGGSSSGTGTVVVPRLTGGPLGNARDTLKAEGLIVATSPAQKDGISYKVTRQTPQAGKRVAAGSTVHLNITATGGDGQTGSRKLPNVVGKHVDDAETALKSAGFGNVTLSQKRDQGRAYTVDRMSPGAGRFANPATAVHLTISPAMHPGSK